MARSGLSSAVRHSPVDFLSFTSAKFAGDVTDMAFPSEGFEFDCGDCSRAIVAQRSDHIPLELAAYAGVLYALNRRPLPVFLLSIY